MKAIAFPLLLIFAGCSTVDVTVNSLSNIGQLKPRPLVFPEGSSNIESEKLRRQCVSGAIAAKQTTMHDRECVQDCYWVIIDGKTGGTRGTVSTSYNAYTKETYVSTGRETARHMKIAVYSDRDFKNEVWQATLDSAGSTSNVLGVAKEMCQAAFKVFPYEVTNHELTIPFGR